ncbi:YwpF-like family protein [Robertmurraya massiliosenegalensis]|uniref:YwpF-like family protein n=1 Tax=Robertmurraya TaxID=2837507 RepID=UPI0039A6D4F6
MKTFKLISLQLVKKDEWLDIPLVDGLIINKEDDHSTWLIEGYIDKSFYDVFHEARTEEKELLVQVVITKKENEPAPFKVKVRSLQSFENHISVLLEGTLKKSTNRYAENLLDSLIQRGLSGDELMEEFRSGIGSKPKFNHTK